MLLTVKMQLNKSCHDSTEFVFPHVSKKVKSEIQSQLAAAAPLQCDS